MKSSSRLQKYNKKRKFSNTPEPVGQVSDLRAGPKVFTIQKHRASHLHYDFRLEDENGVLKSWAVPKGPSVDPQIKRLAVHVEDHPYDYLLFEGSIPRGNYGAGTVIVWDHGTYTTEGTLLQQFEKGKISIELHGQKLRGKFSLVRTRTENQWLLIKSNDSFASIGSDITIDSPRSVLTGRDDISPDASKHSLTGDSSPEKPEHSKSKAKSNVSHPTASGILKNSAAIKPPKQIKPMLATVVDKPFNNKDWAFEVKWDGVRAISFERNGVARLQSRNGNDITASYPEVAEALQKSLAGINSVVLDGEIVVLDKNGHPDFQGHQRRMHVQNIREIEKLAYEIPATYYLFDLLYHDDENMEQSSFLERRKLLTQIIRPNENIRISDYIEERGIEILEHTKRLNLEGIIAKKKTSPYKEGTRSRDWLKIKNIKTQDCVVVGYTVGLGRRNNAFGSLLLAVYNPAKKTFKFVGHSGSGFDDNLIELIYSKLQKIKSNTMAIESLPYKNRETVWVEPLFVAEIKFTGWTKDGIMRAPIFLRFKDDKSPQECIMEADQPLSVIDNGTEITDDTKHPRQLLRSSMTTAIIDSQEFSNIGKIYWNPTKDHGNITKGGLIGYYEAVSELILPHLKDRPLSLSRYPDGINGKSFYHKDWSMSKPDYVVTVPVYSEHREEPINYLVCNNKESLLWIANLGAIEMHPWYSRINDFESCDKSSLLYEEKCGLNFPDFIVFDLDPYIYSGEEEKGQEPEYNTRGFKAAVEVAYHIKDLFNELKIKSFVKTSGKTGLHIYVPIKNEYVYDQTRSFAEIIGKMLMSRFPQKITMEWKTAKRTGKVFFDYNQNSRGKTIASVYSVRPTTSATVSMPVRWEELDSIVPKDFTMLTVPDMMRRKSDPWRGVLENKQDMNSILSSIKK
jgi:bifunctional non-homologous end joining protein LigD